MILVIGSNLLAYISYKSFIKRKQQTTNNNRSAEFTEREKRKQDKIEKKNQKLLIMTIYLTIFSVITHLIQFGAQLLIFVFNSRISSILYGWTNFSYLFIAIFKHFFTIFFYYYFNLNFKRMISCNIMCIKRPNNLNSASRFNNNNIQ